MRFLVDDALSPLVAKSLQAAGHDAVHVRDIGLQDAVDECIFDCARAESRILVFADTDFGTILAMQEAIKPSVILFRGMNGPRQQARLLMQNLVALEQPLEAGSVVVVELFRIRVRQLPIG